MAGKSQHSPSIQRKGLCQLKIRQERDCEDTYLGCSGSPRCTNCTCTLLGAGQGRAEVAHPSAPTGEGKTPSGGEAGNPSGVAASSG